MAHQIELRLTDLKPDDLRSRELAEVITAIEDAVAAYVAAEEPEVSKETVRLGLVQIEDHSVGLGFSLNLREYTVPAFHGIARAVAASTFGSLPKTVLTPLRTLLRFVKNKGCQAEFRITGQSEPLAVLTVDSAIATLPPISGETVLYGTALRTGGKEPKIVFETTDGRTLYCPTTQELAKQAGQRLYGPIALRGMAQWNGETLELEDFTVSELLDYEPVSPKDAFGELLQYVDESYFDFDDPNHFLKELRG